MIQTRHRSPAGVWARFLLGAILLTILTSGCGGVASVSSEAEVHQPLADGSRGFGEYTFWRRYAGSRRGGFTYGNCRKRHEHECDLERVWRPGWQRGSGNSF